MELTTGRPPRQTHLRTLGITAIAMAIVYIIWNIPSAQGLLYPLQLFTTYVHEAGHSLAAILTGGRVIELVVSADTSGYALTGGGAQWIVLPAGYLGTALFGSVLFFMLNRFPRMTNGLAIGLGGFMVGFTLLFARPDESGLPLAMFIGVMMGTLLLVMGLRAPRWLTMIVLNILAVTTALEAFIKLRYLIGRTASRGNVVDDVTAFQREFVPLLPQSLIALSWAAIAIILFAVAVYFGAWKPLHREINEGFERATVKVKAGMPQRTKNAELEARKRNLTDL